MTGNAARGTGILNNLLYVGRRPYGKQTYRKNPETGKRHAFINPKDKRSDDVESPALGIVAIELWNRVKSRQAIQGTTKTVSPEPGLLTSDLGRLYRERVGQLTAAFEDEALKAQAFERLRALIEAV